MMKALKEVKKPLAGGTLTVTQFPVLRAVRVGGRIAKMLAPVLAGLGRGINLDDLVNGKLKALLVEGEIKLGEAVPGVLEGLASSLDPEAFATLCQEMLAGATWVDAAGQSQYDLSQPGTIDAVLGGSIPDLFAALKVALEANDFFGLSAIGKLRGLVGLATPKAASPKSPAVSTPT